jgi:methionyl-tRNA formyltransferase
MKIAGAQLLVRTIRGLADGSLKEMPQLLSRGEIIKTAPKIFPSDCEINWMDPVAKIYNQIRGLSPYPGAFTHFGNKTLKIFRARQEAGSSRLQAGMHEIIEKSALRFAAADGFIYVEEMQLEGKRRMKVGDFLHGYRN